MAIAAYDRERTVVAWCIHGPYVRSPIAAAMVSEPVPIRARRERSIQRDIPNEAFPKEEILRNLPDCSRGPCRASYARAGGCRGEWI